MIIWHVDDLKISHKDAGKVTKMIPHLEYIYGAMSVNQVKNHTYLSMEMYFTGKATVNL